MGRMSGELAGAADILTGAAIARAVEPEAGEGQIASGNCQLVTECRAGANNFARWFKSGICES